MKNRVRTFGTAAGVTALLLCLAYLLLRDDGVQRRDFPTCPGLRELAGDRIIIGSAVKPGPLVSDDNYRDVVLSQFNSITHESDLKWMVTEPEHRQYNWGNADLIADFARENDLAIRGHTLVWPNEFQYQDTPDYVRLATDPLQMQGYIDDHIRAVVTRYADVVDRWDVINEPLRTWGAAIDGNPIRDMLGEAWMVRAFQLVRELDPDARLYLNEALAERPNDKHEALKSLVGRLRAAGAPIDGVGLQAHFFLVGTPGEQAFERVLLDWQELGLDVAITELDIPLVFGGEDRQADYYRRIVTTCLKVPACKEVTFWGFSDRYSWLNDFVSPRLKPLIFDNAYLPKPAYGAIREALAAAGG